MNESEINGICNKKASCIAKGNILILKQQHLKTEKIVL